MAETADPPDLDFDIEDEKFRVQLHLVLKLLTFEWEANLELLATKLQELCQKYIKHKSSLKGVTDAIIPVQVAIDAVKVGGNALANAYTSIPVQVVDTADQTIKGAVEAARTQTNSALAKGSAALATGTAILARGNAAIAEGNALLNAYVPASVTAKVDETVQEAVEAAKAKGTAVVEAYVPVKVVQQADTATKLAKGVASRLLWGSSSEVPDTASGDDYKTADTGLSSKAESHSGKSAETAQEGVVQEGVVQEEVERQRELVYDETIDETSCHLIITNPTFEDKLDDAGGKQWLTTTLLTVLSGTVPSDDATQPKPELKDDNYGDFHYATKSVTVPLLQSTEPDAKPLESRLYLRFANFMAKPASAEDVQNLIKTTLYPSTNHTGKIESYSGTELVPSALDFQEAWDREVLAEWYRGANLLWSGDPPENDEDAKEGDGSGSPGLGGIVGALPLGNASGLVKSALEVGEVAVDMIESSKDDKKETKIEARIEAKDDKDPDTKTKVETKVEMKVAETLNANGSAQAGPSLIETAVETVVHEGASQIEAKVVETAAAALGKSEASILKSVAAIEETEASLVKSAVALGQSEPLGGAAIDLVEQKTAIATSVAELAQSKDSLVQSAVALGASKSSMFGTALKIADTVGESMGVDLIDTDKLSNGKEKKLTGWEKLKAEFPCPIDYPADHEYKAKFTMAVDDCIPSLKSAEGALSCILELYFAKSTPGYTADSFRDRQLLNKLLVATHRVVVTFICSENMVRYVTGVESAPLGDNLLDTGLDGVEAALGMLGPNPAAMVAAGVLKAGRELAEKKKKDAAAKFQKKSTSILRKLWFLTTEVYAFIWFTGSPQLDGKFEFLSSFHRANFKLIRERRVGVYEEDEQPPLDLPEDYFMYLQEQTILLKDFTEEFEGHSKEMVEGLDKIIAV
ncbi:hypothetical protein TWF694_005708 [Orbilia ellipsospora]|uniref:Uncharacterized protein n=1 Tax=Orbilia ellipsospora TaxID=2528407 RepID=A0AAV9WRP5_9PEZI